MYFSPLEVKCSINVQNIQITNMSTQKPFDLKKMNRISVKYVTEDSTFAYHLYDERGNIALPYHETFSKTIKLTLLNKGIKHLFFYPEQELAVEEKEIPVKSALQLYIEKGSYNGPRTISVDTQKKAVGIMDKLVYAAKNVLIEIDQSDVEGLVDAINNDLDHNEHEIVNLLDVIDHDDYTYTHSLNVGVISTFFARQLRLNETEIKQIGIGAFLHDIGKLRIPKEILSKEDSLTPKENSLLQKHPELGLDLLKNNSNISPLSKEIVLYHHEKIDGSGYPRQLEGDDYKLHYEVVSLANIFDSLTSKRGNHETLDSSNAVNHILNSKQHYRPSTIDKFAKNMRFMFRENAFYPIDSFVLLNTSEIAKVTTVNNQHILRPQIKIISDVEGKRLSNPIYIDLAIDYSREIIRKFTNEEVNK